MLVLWIKFKVENNLERKSILKESWENTKSFMNYVGNIFFPNGPFIKSYGEEVLQKYNEIKREINEQVKEINKSLLVNPVESMARSHLDIIDYSLEAGLPLHCLETCFSEHEQLRGVLRKYDNFEFHFNQDENKDGKIYPEEQNIRYLRLEDRFKKMKSRLD